MEEAGVPGENHRSLRVKLEDCKRMCEKLWDRLGFKPTLSATEVYWSSVLPLSHAGTPYKIRETAESQKKSQWNQACKSFLFGAGIVSASFVRNKIDKSIGPRIDQSQIDTNEYRIPECTAKYSWFPTKGSCFRVCMIVRFPSKISVSKTGNFSRKSGEKYRDSVF